jgi:S-adenosyl-L-methionine hydrolase (adenosine-forming)
MAILTLLTDFGTDDYYVGAVKGTVLRLAPGSLLVDLSHDLPAGDVEGASFLLAAAAPSFAAGTVHLAVVDPGVGSERRILVAAARSQLWVAPDNGLLTPLLDDARVWAVERRDLFLDAPGSTFHGRDRFAPVAAFLLRGGDPAELGGAVEAPVRLQLAPPRRSAHRLVGRVAHVDRFGNLVTDIPAAWLGARRHETRIGAHSTRRTAGYYAELAPGEAAVIPGSLGTLELSLNGEDLARRWGVGRGDRVEVALEGEGPRQKL